MRHKFFLLTVCMAVVFLFFASCQKKEEKVTGQKKLSVVTSLFPLYDFAKSVGKEKVDVVLLLPPGVEPHSFEPKPGDVAALAHTDLFIYTNRYMEPWIDNILKGTKNKELLVVDSSKGITLTDAGEAEGHGKEHGHGMKDPHIWLDLSNASGMVDNILEGFVIKDPANRDFYTRNAEQYKTELKNLDDKYKAVLSGCKKNIFVNGGHFVFGYLAKKYGLRYISAYGFSPDAEPAPRDLMNISRTLKENGLQHIYHEELIAPRVAETIAKETGATILLLHGGHNISKEEFDRGVTFLSIMEKNLESLKTGLQCR